MARCISSYGIIVPDKRFFVTVNARSGDDDHVDEIMLINNSSNAITRIQDTQYIKSVLYDCGPAYRTVPVEFTTDNNGSLATAKLFDQENDEIAIKIASLVLEYEECVRLNCGLSDEDQVMEDLDQEESEIFEKMDQEEEKRVFCVICQQNCEEDEMTGTLECNHVF